MPQDVDMPGIGLDLDLADMTAIGEGRLRGREMAALVKAGLDYRSLPRRIEGGARYLLDAEPPIGAADREHAVGELDIRLGRLEEVRGDAAPLGDQLVGGLDERRPADRDRARASGAPAKRDSRGVALQDPHLVRIDAETLGSELGIGGLMPLSRGLRPHQDRQGAALVEAQFGEFVGRKPGLLDIDRMPELAVTAARPRLVASPRKAGEIGGGERLVQIVGELAAVIVEP